MVVRMTTANVSFKIEEEHLAQQLAEVREMLDGAEHEIVLDCSGVLRVDPNALRAFAELSETADDKEVEIALQGVNVDIYRVLKLMKITEGFRFLP
jgi:anti-anti-sigma regulatory factor